MGFEDQLLNVSPPVSLLPKRQTRVLETGGGGCAPAKPSSGEEVLKVKSKCPSGGVRSASIGCDPAVDDGCVEPGSSPAAKGPVSGSSDCCACLVRLRSLPQLDEGPLEGDASVGGGDDDDVASLAPSAPGSSTPSDQTTEEMVDDCLSAGYETPTESVFNPFAPGPEQLGELAPMILAKPSRVRRIPLRRQLQFDSCDSSSSASDGDADTTNVLVPGPTTDGCPPSDDQMDEEDKRLLGSLYATHYNFILSTVLEEQSSPVRQSSKLEGEDDSPRTPPAAPFLTGIAESCPGAPVRHVSKARKLDPAICKKLDFS